MKLAVSLALLTLLLAPGTLLAQSENHSPQKSDGVSRTRIYS